MQGWAILPNGEKKWLIWIKDWDFNWQGGYDYAEPLDLPAGSEIFMHFTYDNSTANPHQPPERVRFGLQTTDEMGELWLQAITQNPKQMPVLAQDYFAYLTRKRSEFDEFRLRLDPTNVAAHLRLATTFQLMARWLKPWFTSGIQGSFICSSLIPEAVNFFDF